MKAPNGPIILITVGIVILVICWFVITAITTPGRAITVGITLTGFAGIFIWFAETNRFAIARGIIAVGVTTFAAPLSAVEAMTNEAIFSLLETHSPTAEQLREIDQVFRLGWTMLAIGAAFAIVCVIIGGLMHRPVRN